MMKGGNTSNSGKEYGPDDIIRGFAVLHDFMCRDENIQVNGFVYILDLGGFSMGHVTFMGPETFTKATNCWMKAHSGRNKELHFYNGGQMFDVLYGFLKQAFSKKIQDRVVNHGNNFSSIYKYVDKSMLPEEYLPDDYDGPCAGPKQKILDEYLVSLKSSEFREYMATLTNGQYFVDSAKKPKKGQQENASFRPLVMS
ncbi:alpha-tocopherol transfer protein-like [Liolophura sinensis]|uniref:alpha-tocopherol transfer protein-like n=1 Tax=Liolophura sinensis TaxID=3198878 RepID=UPI00315968C9